MQNQIGPDLAAHVVIPYFLRTLMKIERQRLGHSRQAASRMARWSSSAWGHFERGTRNLQPHHWINISAALDITAEDEVRRLNAFIGKHASIWLEKVASGEIRVCERALTSPRPLRTGNVFGYELNPIRPQLYYELSSYAQDPERVIEVARALGMLEPREARRSAPPPAVISPEERSAKNRERLCEVLMKQIETEKLGLLERVLEKFRRCPADELAHAYKHFSLSISKSSERP
ncbi:MAG: helix-turn-helix domain-containing protein [Deltaproteobacteria bacterium]|nr:helix-turn-helix domain-containing protein [Deltaproteobacteria bacterium]